MSGNIGGAVEIKKYINDPVYGLIGLTEVETELIDTRIFQRLRGLRQLARVNYVFPGTEHSRFVHSLGVLSNMSKMTDRLLQIDGITKKEAEKLRVAALLHDIGHYPLSHLGENAYGYIKDHSSTDKSIVDTIGTDNQPIYKLASSNSKSAHHEELGQYIVENNDEINKILKKHDIDAAEIGNIFRGVIVDTEFLYTQLIHSSLDADRLDYLLRDSYQSGLKYGIVDIDYLISLMNVKSSSLIPTSQKRESKLLVFDEKGKHVIEHFLMARYFHYSQLVHHKTSVAFEGLIRAMYIKLIQENDSNRFIYSSLEEIKEAVNDESIYNFTDSFLEYELYDCYENTSDEEYRILYDCYRKRIRPKTLFEYKDRHGETELPKLAIFKNTLINNPDMISKIMQTKLWGYSVAKPDIEKLSIIKEKPTDESDDANIKNRVEAVKTFDSDGNIKFLADDPSTTIKDLISKDVEFVRVYCIDPSKTQKEYDEIRKELNDLFEG